MFGSAAFVLASFVQGEGEVCDFGGEEFEFAAKFGIVFEAFADFRELLPSIVVLFEVGEFFGAFDGGFDFAEVFHDLFEGVEAGGVAIDGLCEFVMAFGDFAVVAFGEEAVEVVACGDDDGGVGDEVAEFLEFGVGRPEFGGGLDLFRGFI